MGPLEPQPVPLAFLQLSLPVSIFLQKEQPVSLPHTTVARVPSPSDCPLLAANSLSPGGLPCPLPLSNEMFFFQFKTVETEWNFLKCSSLTIVLF